MYRVYMGEFKIAMKTLVSYEADSLQFKEILTLLQQSPLCERLTLASYLLTPIQRLPRYELLLKVSRECVHTCVCVMYARTTRISTLESSISGTEFHP